MSDFKSSGNSGRYSSGLPYTSFHKEGQLWDSVMGDNIAKTSFWRTLTYYAIFIGLFFIVILTLTIFSPPPLLRVVEVSEKGKVLFWGELEKSPIVISGDKINYLESNKSLAKWQNFLDQNKDFKRVVNNG